MTALLIIPNGRADFSPVPLELEVAEIIQKTLRHGRLCRPGALFEASLWLEGEHITWMFHGMSTDNKSNRLARGTPMTFSPFSAHKDI